MRKQFFRAPAGRLTIVELLSIVWPEATGDQLMSAISVGQFMVDGEMQVDGAYCPGAGARIHIVGTPAGSGTSFKPSKQDLLQFEAEAHVFSADSDDGSVKDFWDLEVEDDVDLSEEFDSDWSEDGNVESWDSVGKDWDLDPDEVAAAERAMAGSRDPIEVTSELTAQSDESDQPTEIDRPVPVHVYHREGDLIVVEKPVGKVDAPLGVSAAQLKLWSKALGTKGQLRPCFPMDWATTGPWLLCADDEKSSLIKEAFSKGEFTLLYRAIVPRLVPVGGMLKGRGEVKLEASYRTVEKNAELSDLEITLQKGRLKDLRLALAKMGAAILGDGSQGGILVEGGLHLRMHRIALPSLGIEVESPEREAWLPSEGLLPPRTGKAVPELAVSSATLKALLKGHQWCLADGETGDYRRYRPGTLVRLIDAEGRKGPAAVIDGQGAIAARAWGHRASYDALATRFGIAMKHRAGLFGFDSPTTAFRLIHGEHDGFPGINVDVMGKVLRSTVTSRCCEGYLGRLYGLLKERFPDYTLLEWVHISDLRMGEQQATRRIFGPSVEAECIVVESGLKFKVDLMGGSSTGFYPDQRENRRRVLKHVKAGQRWLNLFCHTGAYTVALMKAGAEVVSVDASSRYLRWMAENIELNGLDASLNTTIKRDARDAIAKLDGTFHGVILDPPTAASGKRFWSSRTHYKALLGDTVRLLKPGGVILACRNDRKRKPALKTLLERTVVSEEVGWASIEEAGPSSDYPRIPGFPEGDAFEGLLAQRGVATWHPLDNSQSLAMPSVKSSTKSKRSRGKRRRKG